MHLLVQVLVQNAWDDESKGVLKDINCIFVSQILHNDLHNAGSGHIAALKQVEQAIVDLLALQAALNLVKTCLQCGQSHLVDAEFTVAVALIVDEKGVDLLRLLTHELVDLSLGLCG